MKILNIGGVRMSMSAFDHPLVAAHGSVPIGADRVIVPPACQCRVCQEREARIKAGEKNP